MADRKEKVVYWADKSRTWGGTHNFGDEVTGLIDPDRLEKFLDDGTVSEEKQQSVEMASQSKLMKLEIQIESKDQQILDLKAELKATPKNITAARKEIKDLESAVIEKDIEIDKLDSEINGLTAPKKSGDK